MCIISMLLGIVSGGYWMGRKYCLKLVETRILSEKHLNIVKLYDIWMMTKQNGASIAQYLSDNDIRTIAIYGMSFMGIRLLHELKGSSIRIEYGIDCNPKMRIPELKIYHLKELGKVKVDAIIVTAIFSFDKIKNDLEKLGFDKIIGLDEILYNLI